ncbi:cell wall-binding repeat-containing protein [Jeotgalibacillus sp. S-D1]|uniref:cell wall-binding repeat-containing protein n=1 Tax=Jeotgalibacillus sp. S-D1 TaxID=2552189 RepID=UPI00105A27AB|nr:cell wall-binding repeat-containing protein [Jeotgalibacillus sp. S-D1]TDL32599.1 cell wall-binding repeat-containing protein [Jeotgalibacillus sp. S-D1]
MKSKLILVSSILLGGSLLAGQSSFAEGDKPLVKNNEGISVSDYGDDMIFYEEEPNDSFDLANSIVLDDVAVGSLVKDDKDFYKLTIEGDQSIPFEAGAGIEAEETEKKILVELYGEDQQKIEPAEIHKESDTYGFSAELEPGTYYLAVSDEKNIDSEQEYYLYAFGYSEEPVVSRMFGEDRYETAFEIAKTGWFEDETPHIILATGSEFPDALAGSPLAYEYDAPILLTRKNSVPSAVKEAIEYFGVEKVTILGGTGAVSKEVETYLKKTLKVNEVTRVAGKDRYETAALIASELPGNETAFVANGSNYPDALSVASHAASTGSPILLTRANSVPAATTNALENYNDSWAIGGTAAISKEVFKELPRPKRIAGKDRYETSVQVVRQLKMDTDFVNLATGQNFADALTGSVLAALYDEPVLLTRSDRLPTELKDFIVEKDVYYFTILGGSGAVSYDVDDEILSLFE